jgi:hypothetical protein
MKRSMFRSICSNHDLARGGRAAKLGHQAAMGTLTTGTGCRFAVSKA